MQSMPRHGIPSGMIAGMAMTAAARAVAQTPSLIPADGRPGNCDLVSGKIDASCIPGYIAYLIGTLFSTSGVIFLIMLMWGGYQYLLGSADLMDKEAGKARMRFAIAGFLVSSLAIYIVFAVFDALG